ncbi:DNA-binding protein [Lysinibacillus parviboronicapiens]|uniref:DNA-binding protein n=1 Tax=Lysinibacillus parviboronicapiens TaxID=436516 RepID=A0ABV2PR83_9BACI
MASLAPLTIERAYMTFLFPFAYHMQCRDKLCNELTKENFSFFTLQNKSLEDAFYGESISISHEELAQFFYPFIEDKLFPDNSDRHDFIRFSKAFHAEGSLQYREDTFAYEIVSIDITLCPFGNGIITMRTKMTDSAHDFSDVLNFIHYFRVLEAKLWEEKGASHHFPFGHFSSTGDLLFKHFVPYLLPYLPYQQADTYDGLPFFEDERMFSSAFLLCKEGEKIVDEHLFRLGQVDGKKPDGNPFISSTNPHYIADYVKEHTHTRWAPNSYIVTSAQAQIAISNLSFKESKHSIEEFMGTHYYNLFIHYFYKMMLLKVSFEYSEISWRKDKLVVDELIELITKFSARYYFDEVVVRTEGKEISQALRKFFRINEHYIETKATLESLYRTLEDRSDNRNNRLLFILTVFTVVSGIYGMNLVIEEWDSTVDWKSIFGYTAFEWFALIIALSGIGLSLVLICYSIFTTFRNHFRRYKRNLP